MKKRPWKSSIALVGAVTLLVSACSGTAAPDAGSSQQTAVFAMTSRGVSSLDPLSDVLVTNNAYTLDKIMEPLVELQPDGSIAPWLAEDYAISEDGLTWTFTIREGVQFSDGSDLDSGDVLYTFERHLEVGGAMPISAPVTQFSAPDAATFVVELERPYAALLADFATFAYGIVPEDLNGQSAEEFFEAPVGTGPFQVKEWDKVGGEITLERNEHYWVEGQPKLDEVEFIVVQDNNQLVQQLIAGQVDIADNIPSSQLKELESNDSVETVVTSSWLQYLLAFNTVDTQFSNTELRRAVAFALDRDALASAGTDGTGTPGTTYLPDSILYSAQDLDVPVFDPDQAAQLLAESGHAEGTSATLIVEGGDETLMKLAAATQAYLADIGIDITIESLDGTAFWNRFGARDYELAIAISTSDTGDPSNLSTWQLDPAVMDSYNTGYNNPAVLSLMAQGLETTESAERERIYREIQQLVADDSPTVPLVYKSSLIGVQAGLTGLVVLPNGTTRLAEVAFE